MQLRRTGWRILCNGGGEAFHKLDFLRREAKDPAIIPRDRKGVRTRDEVLRMRHWLRGLISESDSTFVKVTTEAAVEFCSVLLMEREIPQTYLEPRAFAGRDWSSIDLKRENGEGLMHPETVLGLIEVFKNETNWSLYMDTAKFSSMIRMAQWYLGQRIVPQFDGGAYAPGIPIVRRSR